MLSTRKNEPIRAWESGDSVSGFAYLAKKERRQDRNGNDYLDLELADATGAINGKAWSDSQAMGRDFEVGDFVAFKGQVSSYNNRLQLSVKDCRQVTEEDKARGLDVAKLIPSAAEDIGVLWERLTGLLEAGLERPEARRLATETLAAYGEALKEHPAAKGYHHAYRGGLLEHVVSMAQVANLLCDHYRELDRDQLLLGALFHDLGKLLELEPMPSKEYTEEGRLVGHVVIGYQMLRQRCAAIPDFPLELQRRLEHLVLSHQGSKEFGSPVEPATAEALALNYIDDLDAKLSMLRRAREEGLEGRQWVDALRRFVFLDALEERLEEQPPPGPEQAQLEL
ncbi:MAG: 3'-5' exoribonuclease YhaM family protein [Thermoanaerobaculia bacterium]